MRRLGYARYVAQGGHVGQQVTDAMGRLGLDRLICIQRPSSQNASAGDCEGLSKRPAGKS